MEETHETLLGYRQFKVHVNPFKQRLFLVGSYGGTWDTGTMQAMCGKPDEFENQPGIPQARYQLAESHLKENKCQCGIYSFTERERSEFIAQYSTMRWTCTNQDFYEQDGRLHTSGSPVAIIGQAQVLNWGYMVEGRKGWRSQWSRIEQLWLNRPREKCTTCGWKLIPSTISNRDQQLYWICDFKQEAKYEALMNGLDSQLRGYYQCILHLEVD